MVVPFCVNENVTSNPSLYAEPQHLKHTRRLFRKILSRAASLSPEPIASCVCVFLLLPCYLSKATSVLSHAPNSRRGRRVAGATSPTFPADARREGRSAVPRPARLPRRQPEGPRGVGRPDGAGPDSPRDPVLPPHPIFSPTG